MSSSWLPYSTTRRARRPPLDQDHVRQLAPAAFDRARNAIGLEHARPYDLRHSFASLLLHEGRSIVCVARQLGHDARLTLTTYGHVIDELEDAPRVAAEDAIRAARRGSCGTGVERAAGDA